MKIAVVTDDEQTISRHFGRARYYLILTVENGVITARERVEKPAHHGHHHHHDHHDHSNVSLHDDHTHEADHAKDEAGRHADMFAPLHGCDVVLTRGMGNGAYNGLQQINVRPIITDIDSIEAAVNAVIDGSIIDHPEKLH